MTLSGTAELRDIGPGDFEHWMPLWQGYQNFYQVVVPEAATRTTWTRLLDPREPVFGAIAWESGLAVGLAHWIYHRNTWSIEDDCYLNDLFVAPTHRRRSIGCQLIEFAAHTARKDGCGQLYWLTHETNASAIRLYQRVADRTGFVDFRIRFQ
jgi:GNAT superfamily N-acetyltransferase